MGFGDAMKVCCVSHGGLIATFNRVVSLQPSVAKEGVPCGPWRFDRCPQMVVSLRSLFLSVGYGDGGLQDSFAGIGRARPITA